MGSNKSKEKSSLGEMSGPKSNHAGKEESLHKDFGVFGKIEKIDLSLREDDLDYLIYAQFVSQK